MSMFFQYGNFRHDDNEVDVNHRIDTISDERGFSLYVRHRLDVSGKLHANSDLELTTRMNQMLNAYSQNGRSGGLRHSNGQPTSHWLENSDAVGGVQVIQLPSFGGPTKGEYTTFRSFSLSLEARYFSNESQNLLAFEEQLTIIGTGGPKRVLIETIDTLPIAQITRKATVIRAVQTGRALGAVAYPPFPGLLFPGREISEQIQQTRVSPMRLRNHRTEWGITWMYPYQSNTPLIGIPHSL